MNKRIIVNGYSPIYCRALLEKGRDKYGSLRQLAKTLGIAQAVIYRWHNGESKMGEKWVKSLEQLLQVQS